MSPSSGVKMYSRSYNTDAALPLRVAQTLHPSGTLVEGGESGAQVGRITAVCGRKHKLEECHPATKHRPENKQATP